MREDRRAWVAIGAAASLRMTLVRPLFVEASAGVLTPLLRTRYIFAPDTTLYRPPAVGGEAAALVGAELF